ncbi:MAG: TonB-dependent receptor [Bacteroidetes bacterium]|nr:TonB-dependent receptor [Bacteroidota bacterium]
MKKIFLLLFFPSVCFSQNTFHAVIKDEKTNEALAGAGAVIKELNLSGIADASGKVELKNIPDGKYIIRFSFVGYRENNFKADFPMKNPDGEIKIFLEPNIELEEVTVTSTRTGNRIEETPIKVEVLGTEEVDEKSAMMPGNISMLLTEYTGIQPQITSAKTGNVNLKMQGLDGKYTQFLKDGFPIYGGFSGGLGLMQTPPLDLKQVEIIKGASSTLYGGDAIAGVVNLITKEPIANKDEWNILLNQTSLGGTDISSFYSKRKDKLGITFLAASDREISRDVNGDFFTDQPQVQGFNFNPKLFYYFSDSSKLMLGIFSGYENRMGGDIIAITHQPDSVHNFIEKNSSNRNVSQLKYEKIFRNGNVFTVKNSINYFDRSISGSNSDFHGTQLASYSEISYLKRTKHHDFVSGINFLTDNFSEDISLSKINRGYDYSTVGIFLQDDWKIFNRTTFEAGIRGDYNNRYGSFILPRVSVLYKFSNKFFARAGGGMGYKTPSIFAEEAEEQGFGRGVQPIASNVKSETSIGANLDFNFKTQIGNESSLAINQSFFYAQIQNAIEPNDDSVIAGGQLIFQNLPEPITSMGTETTFNLWIEDFNFITGYTYTHAFEGDPEASEPLPLTAKHRLMLDLFWEIERKWKIGVEAFYMGQQTLHDKTTRPDYWLTGFIVQRKIKNYMLVFNVEDLLDERQTRHESIYSGTVNNPHFKEVWAPLEGFVANVVLKISL